MQKHTFVTEASVFGDQKVSVKILEPSDVEKIALKVALVEGQELADGVNRELRKLSTRIEAVRKDAEEQGKRAEEAGKMAAETRTGQVVASARETFRAIVRDSLTPIFEAGTGQILDNQQAMQAEHKTMKDEAAAVALKVAALEERMAALEAENKRLKKDLEALRREAGKTARTQEGPNTTYMPGGR